MEIRPGTVLAAAAALGAAASLSAQTAGLSISAEASWNSSYVWRGAVLDPKAAFQTSTTLQYRGCSLNVWTSRRASEAFLTHGPTEVDYTLSHQFSRGKISAAPTVIYYTFPGQATDAAGEFLLGASYDAGACQISLNQYFGFLTYAGTYYGELGISKETSIGPRTALGSTFTMGWGNRSFHSINFGLGVDAVSSASAQLYVSHRLAGVLSLRSSVSLVNVLGARLRSASGAPSSVVWGLTVGMEK